MSIQTIKKNIIENSMTYFRLTGEQIDWEILSLFTDSLIDEYKSKRNYPEYFTDEQIDTDVSLYFSRKSTYFAMKVIPSMIGKIGAEGQGSHSENGISRSWEAESWFADVIPYCEVL